jgi:hypothetical protein
MSEVLITIGDLRFDARFEERAAPRTCAAFRTLMPFEQRLVQARFSGEAAWVPLGDLRLDIPPENATGEPQRGELLLYPGGVSETELLFPYGTVRFACKAGPLAGNHFMTLTSGLEQLHELGRRVLWEGAQTIRIGAA